MTIKVLDGPADYSIDEANLSYKFTYELDHFQKHSIRAINNNENVLVTAHTGSGKTCVAIYAIAHTLKKNKTVIYCSPIKTLSNQKYKEFKDIFEPIGKTVGLMTGDNKIQPNADCIIMTTEILRNALYNKETPDDNSISIDYNELDCVIFDEIHYINDKSRGKVWEETLSLLNPDITLVMLSATIENSYEFASWISTLNSKVINLIPTERRIIPLNHYIYIDNKMFHILDNDNNFSRLEYDKAYNIFEKKMAKLNRISQLNSVVSYMKDNNLFQALFFSFSRKRCEEYAKAITLDLVTNEEKNTICAIFDKHMGKYDSLYREIKQYTEIKKLLLSGICYHHSGLVPIFKEIIEIIFQEGLVKVLFATETFAVGVNMPTKTVIFTELQKYDGDLETMRNLETSEYKQMSGRAGRRGLDDYGMVIILPIFNMLTRDHIWLKNIMTGQLPIIKSKFKIDINYILKVISKLDLYGSVEEIAINIENFTKRLLYTVDNNKIIEEREQEYNKLSKITSTYNFSNTELFEKYNSLSEGRNTMPANITIRKGKSSKTKEKAALLKEIKAKGLEGEYSKYLNYKKHADDINYIKNDIDYAKNKIKNESETILCELVLNNYLDTNNNNRITIKGTIASQINEYNPILLTEIIFRNILEGLTEIEIGAVLSIFIGESLPDSYSSYIPTCNIVEALNNIDDIIDDYRYNDSENWQITDDYIDIVVSWLSMESLARTIGNKIYIGNFIKSMLKLSNLIKDIVYLCTLSGHIDLIPKLENINKLLVRDVVTINSLYL